MADFTLLYKYVMFGFLNYYRKKQKPVYIINLIIILAKFHIHKSKFARKNPLFSCFHKDCDFYLQSIKSCTNKKAVKTVNECLYLTSLCFISLCTYF